MKTWMARALRRRKDAYISLSLCHRYLHHLRCLQCQPPKSMRVSISAVAFGSRQRYVTSVENDSLSPLHSSMTLLVTGLTFILNTWYLPRSMQRQGGLWTAQVNLLEGKLDLGRL